MPQDVFERLTLDPSVPTRGLGSEIRTFSGPSSVAFSPAGIERALSHTSSTRVVRSDSSFRGRATARSFVARCPLALPPSSLPATWPPTR
jgi:hypothetical protein